MQVEDGQDVRRNVGDDHVGDEDAEGQGGERQIEATEAKGRQRDEAADDGRDGHAEERVPTA